MSKARVKVNVVNDLDDRRFDSDSEDDDQESYDEIESSDDDQAKNSVEGESSNADDESDSDMLKNERLSPVADKENLNDDNEEKSGMESVIARILSKDISKSNRVLLAKGKTDKEVKKDIEKRRRKKEESEPSEKMSKKEVEEPAHIKEEKRKIWEAMGRKIPTVLDVPKETRLRKIATMGMVQLFRTVNEHQKNIKSKLSATGGSERKKDKVMKEFTKGKFLDLLKGREAKIEKQADDQKWKILQDDFMMGAGMKDWDKAEESDADEMAADKDSDMLSDND